MKLTIAQLYDLSQSTGLPVLAKDGLPITSLIAMGEYYYFGSAYEDPSKSLDFERFFLECIHRICWDVKVAGECEMCEHDGIKWIGVTLFADKEKGEPEELQPMRRMKDLFEVRQEEFVVYRFVKDGCPEEDAKKEDWESMVEALYDGEENVAYDEFLIWLGQAT